jgi:hypothetical protein
MRGLVVEGRIGLLTPIRREGQLDWVTARSVRNLFKTSCLRRAGMILPEAAAPPVAIPPPETGEDVFDAMLPAEAVKAGSPVADGASGGRDAVLDALGELDSGSDEDWDAFFQEQGQRLNDGLAAAAMLQVPSSALTPLEPEPLTPLEPEPLAMAKDGLVLRTDAAPVAVVPARPVPPGPPSSPVPVVAADPVPSTPGGTMENLTIGERSSNNLAVALIVGLAVVALGIAAFLLIKSFLGG